MKTPREILIDQHRHTEPKLDAIRQRVLLTHLGVRPTHASAWGWMSTLWHELFLPCRVVWGGLAAVWVALLLLHLGQAEGKRPHWTAPVAQAGATKEELRGQWLLRAELLGTASVKPLRSPEAPGPQSEAVPEESTAFRRLETQMV